LARQQDLEVIRDWLQARPVEEAVMESTGQYYKPVWLQREGTFGCIWRKLNRTEAPKVARETSPMRCESEALSARRFDSQLRTGCRTADVAQIDADENEPGQSTHTAGFASESFIRRDDAEIVQCHQ
jgi:hypothetical protein